MARRLVLRHTPILSPSSETELQSNVSSVFGVDGKVAEKTILSWSMMIDP
jgi:hypothetical protein